MKRVGKKVLFYNATIYRKHKSRLDGLAENFKAGRVGTVTYERSAREIEREMLKMCRRSGITMPEMMEIVEAMELNGVTSKDFGRFKSIMLTI